MKTRPRRGLQDVRTNNDLTGDAKNPQRRFLRVANLELRKTICNRIKEASCRRIAEMDLQLAAIQTEQAQLLHDGETCGRGGGQAGLNGPPDDGFPPPSGRGFTIKY